MSAATAVRVLLYCGLVLLPAAIVRADGLYQRTRDGKTLVWNDSPRPGDAATWSGDRDGQGYATGFGTLTWHTSGQHNKKPNGIVYAHYFGNMVHGKLNGPVNGHSKGVTSHAFFAQGKRTTRWTAGTVPSWKIPQSKPEAPTESLAAVNIEKTKPAESNPPRPTYDRPASNRPMPDFHSLHEESDAAAQDVPAEGPGATARQNAGQSTAALPPQSKPKLKMDASLRSLTGPPSALRDSTEAASQNESRDQEFASSTAPQLSKQDAIELAEAQAKQRGYDLTKYRRPDPQFDVTDNTWTLAYEREPGDGTASGDRRFTVAIDDKSKRTAIVAGH